MLTLRGEHFCFTENIGVIDQIGPLPTLWSVFPLSPGPSNPLSDALAGRISRGNGICSAGPRGHPLVAGVLLSPENPPATRSPALRCYDGQLAVNHHD